ncbi:MAG: ATP phosphoribosyltransferase [bacterium]|nr:ATP phosphoribosyltransferase [bacterium]
MNKIQIVVPDGSMQAKVEGLFMKAGLPIKLEGERKMEGTVGVDWVERVVYQRPQEIPIYLANNHFDVGIASEDWIANWGLWGKFIVEGRLPIGRGGNNPVRIVLAVAETSKVTRPERLPRGCEIATEYVELTRAFFERKGRGDIKVTRSWGKTEQKIAFGATGIVDVTESGRSLKANKLKVLCDIIKPSSMIIVANPKSYADKAKRSYIDCFARLIMGAYQASLYVSLTANVPKEKLENAGWLMGGLKGPSCSPIVGKGKGWFALQSLVLREKEQDIIFALLQIGVTDIIVNRDIPLIMSNREIRVIMS